jgi:hypothetical protein
MKDEWKLTCIALFKIGSGEDITKAAQPGTFDLKVF